MKACAIGTRRGPDCNCVLFGVNGQRRQAGRAALIASRVVEADIVYVPPRENLWVISLWLTQSWFGFCIFC